MNAERCAAVCSIPDCTSRRLARGWCSSHYHRWQRYGDPLGSSRPKLPPLYIEDVEWMVETGEHVEGAAKRLGRTVQTLEKALERAGRRDLYAALKSRVLVAA